MLELIIKNRAVAITTSILFTLLPFIIFKSPKSIFINCAYYYSLIPFLAWLYSLFIAFPEYLNFDKFKQVFFSKLNLFNIFLVLILCISVDAYLRVLADEANVLTVSRSMFFDKHSYQVSQSYSILGEVVPVQTRAPSRTGIFSFIISIFHTILGYSVSNAFLLNCLIFWILITVVSQYLSKRFNSLISSSVLLLLISSPIFVYGVRSAYYDIFCCLLFLLLFIIIESYLREQSEEKWNALWMTIVMIALVRHEGLAYLFTLMICLLATKKIRKEYLYSKYVIYTPIFISQIIWHLCIWYYATIEAMKSMKGGVFEVNYFVSNLSSLFLKLVSFNLDLPLCHFVIIGGIIFTIFYYLMRVRESRLKNVRFFHEAQDYIFCLVLVYLMIHLSFFMGQADESASARFYILPIIFLSVIFVLGLRYFIIINDKIILLISTAIFLCYYPYVVKDKFSIKTNSYKEYRTISQEVLKLADKKSTYILPRANWYTPYLNGSLSFSYANSAYRRIRRLFNSGRLENLYVVQKLNVKKNSPTPDSFLTDRYKLEVIKEKMISLRTKIVISKVKEID